MQRTARAREGRRHWRTDVLIIAALVAIGVLATVTLFGDNVRTLVARLRPAPARLGGPQGGGAGPQPAR